MRARTSAIRARTSALWAHRLDLDFSIGRGECRSIGITNAHACADKCGSMSSRPHSFGKRVLALALGSLMSLAFLELGYRWLRLPALGPTTNPSYVQQDAELGWVYRPHATARHRTGEFDVSIAINSRGFRGGDWGPRQPGRPRVLVLGDSYAFGWGVEQPQSFSARLQALMPEWEILNAAVSGYGTDQQYLLLLRLLPDVQPDLVIDVFCSNDRVESASSVSYGKRKPYFARGVSGLELHGVPIPEPPWLERTSFLYRAITKERAERASAEIRPDPEQGWALVCDIYREMSKRLGPVPLVIVSSEQRLAYLAADEKSLHHVDLRPLFRSKSEKLTFPIDGHWTAAAHAAIAKELSTALRPMLP